MQFMSLSRVPGTINRLSEHEFIEEEIVAQVKLDDMTCSVAAPDTTPKAAVLAIPRGKEALRIFCDACFERKQSISLICEAPTIGLLCMNWRGSHGG